MLNGLLLRRKAAELESRALRSEVAADKGVPSSLLTGSTREELEASADALIEFRGERESSFPFIFCLEASQ